MYQYNPNDPVIPEVVVFDSRCEMCHGYGQLKWVAEGIVNVTMRAAPSSNVPVFNLVHPEPAP
jgi:hypothetical protein